MNPNDTTTQRTDNKGSVKGIMWYCGDDVCACSQPRIITRDERGYFVSEECAEELFVCDAELEERKQQALWLLKRSRELNVDNLEEVESEYGHYEKETK